MSMQETTTKRPLSELKARASAVLELNSKLREKFLEIARTRLPSPSFDLAEATARVGSFSPTEAVEIAKATRWLAVILRDYGLEEFNRITA